ncbi:hypothetical protein B1812_05840 [Methylocystis bryophila]|uniref:Uncharacterized protein n=1 Tax=Methylocystis bryophila TaxID=655015 RepID=A0A1W6MST0_9HYPH|nr:hypothetical protein B1812_05840 [Methylocystis bryophila]
MRLSPNLPLLTRLRWRGDRLRLTRHSRRSNSPARGKPVRHAGKPSLVKIEPSAIEGRKNAYERRTPKPSNRRSGNVALALAIGER